MPGALDCSLVWGQAETAQSPPACQPSTALCLSGTPWLHTSHVRQGPGPGPGSRCLLLTRLLLTPAMAPPGTDLGRVGAPSTVLTPRQGIKDHCVTAHLPANVCLSASHHCLQQLVHLGTSMGPEHQRGFTSLPRGAALLQPLLPAVLQAAGNLPGWEGEPGPGRVGASWVMEAGWEG